MTYGMQPMPLGNLHMKSFKILHYGFKTTSKQLVPKLKTPMDLLAEEERFFWVMKNLVDLVLNSETENDKASPSILFSRMCLCRFNTLLT